MTTRSEIQMRPATSEDWPTIAAFYRRHQDAAERTLTLFSWRDRNAAASGGNHPMLAWDGDDLCGIINSVPVELSLRGMRVHATWHHDSLVDSAMRGRGVGKKLSIKTAEEAPVVLGKGASDAMYGLRKSMGFEDRDDWRFMVCVLRPLTWGSMARRAAFFLFWLRGRIRRPRIAAGLELRKTSEFDEAVDQLIERIASDDEVVPVKSKQYLSWRYQSVPGRAYVIWSVYGDEGLRGCAVVRPPDRAGGDAWLVDVIARTNDRAAMQALLQGALNTAREAGAACIRTFATSPRARRALSEAGYSTLRVAPRFTFWIRKPSPEIVQFKEAPWNIWHGDGDSELY